MIQDEASGARTPSDVTKSVQLMRAKAGSELGPLTVLGNVKASSLPSLYNRNFSYFDFHGKISRINLSQLLSFSIKGS